MIGLAPRSISFSQGILGHIARARDKAGFASERFAAGGQHLGGEIDSPIPGRFRPDQTAPPTQILAGENAGEFVADAFVHAEEIADLPRTHADVACRDIGIRSDVAIEFAHEALTESHDFGVGFALGVEVGAALAAAHRQGGQRVLENLLESQEFEDAEVHRGMEAKAAFVGADGAVHFDAKAAVDLDVASVIDPRHPEHDHAFRLDDAFHDPDLPIFRMLIEDRSDRFQNFGYGLMELCFVRGRVAR